MRITTAEVKKYLVECVMENGNCTPTDFNVYIKQKSNKEFSKGQVAGAISQLIDKGELVKVERALYRYGGAKEKQWGIAVETQQPHMESKFVNEVETCLKGTAKELTKIVDRADVLNMSEAEFTLLREIKQLKAEFEVILRKYK